LVCSNDTTYYSQCSSAGSSCQSDNDGTYYVCVHVANTGIPTCSNYTLTFRSAP